MAELVIFLHVAVIIEKILIAGVIGRIDIDHVHPATVLTVNTRISVETEQPELAADTQQEIVRRVTRLIEETWHARPIGEQIRMDELFNTVRETPNVRLTLRILAEGAYHQEGQPRLAPLERDGDFPYAVVESGTHLVRVQ